MSRDSVAVIVAEMRAEIVDSWTVSDMRVAKWADRLERLTREAAPQASGGDELPCTDSDNCRRCSEDADTPHSGIPRGTLAHPQAIQSQQGATGGAVDGLLPPEHGAHPAAYEACSDAVEWQVALARVDGWNDCRAEVARRIATLAHPQAAGSAPGEAREAFCDAEGHVVVNDGECFNCGAAPPSAGSVASGAGDCPYSARCDCIGACKHGFAGNGATAAGSAPVGVDAKDGASC